jgi:hypothetical protein
MRLFISYKREELRFANRLRDALEDAGYEVWLDSDDIQAGQKWSNAVQEGLDSADVLLLIATPEAIGSDNVADEWQYFHTRKKTIIPLWLRPTEMPYQLDRLHRIDFTGDFNSSFSKLRTELARIDGTSPSDLADESGAGSKLIPLSLLAAFTLLLLIAIIARPVFFNQKDADGNRSTLPASTQQNTLQATPPVQITASPSITGNNPSNDAQVTTETDVLLELVTVAEYTAFLNGRSFPPDYRDGSGNVLVDINTSLLNFNNETSRWDFEDRYANNMMTNVTWYGARAYCEAQSQGLPSADEIDVSYPTLVWLVDGQIAGRGSVELAEKSFTSSEVSFRCVEN